MSNKVKNKHINFIIKNKKINIEDITKTKHQKSFLKWVGGKTQIMDEVLVKFPARMKNYHELFLGGGSVLLALLTLRRENKVIVEGKIYAYDLNKSLINTFNQIKFNYQDVIDKLKEIKEVFSSIELNTDGKRWVKSKLNQDNYKSTREHYYYWIRDLYNSTTKDSVLSASYFIFLNKTGFKGMFREGNNGYNIPYGQKDTNCIPSMMDVDDIKNISNLIQDVEFKCADFKDSFKEIKPGDFAYLDPPYFPENGASFVGYTKDGFNLDTHKSLFDEIKKLDSDNIKFVMSNSNVDYVKNIFENFNINEITARRAIHSKKPDTKTKEVLIYN